MRLFPRAVVAGFCLIMPLPSLVHAQARTHAQLWVDVIPHLRLSDQFEHFGDYGVRIDLSDSTENTILVRPSIRFELNEMWSCTEESEASTRSWSSATISSSSGHGRVSGSTGPRSGYSISKNTSTWGRQTWKRSAIERACTSVSGRRWAARGSSKPNSCSKRQGAQRTQISR